MRGLQYLTTNSVWSPDRIFWLLCLLGINCVECVMPLGGYVWRKWLLWVSRRGPLMLIAESLKMRAGRLGVDASIGVALAFSLSIKNLV